MLGLMQGHLIAPLVPQLRKVERYVVLGERQSLD